MMKAFNLMEQLLAIYPNRKVKVIGFVSGHRGRRRDTIRGRILDRIRGSQYPLQLTCDRVGSCDSSIVKHGTKHFKLTGHPIIRPLSPENIGNGATSI
jgi:hypothetical protein